MHRRQTADMNELLAGVGDFVRERGLLRPSSTPQDVGVLAALTAVLATTYIVQVNRVKAGRRPIESVRQALQSTVSGKPSKVISVPL